MTEEKYQKEIFNKTWRNRKVRIFWNKNVPYFPRQFKIVGNGGRKKNGDKCFSFTIWLGYLEIVFAHFYKE